jgi:acyl carrier protein
MSTVRISSEAGAAMIVRDGSLTRAAVRGAAHAAWADVLDVPVRDDTDFFDLGGSSITALSICSRLAESLSTRLPLRLLFTHPRFADYVGAVWEIVKEER